MIHAVVRGSLGADAELRFTDGGLAILRFRIASNDRQQVDGEWRDVPTWVSVDVVGKRAEGLSKVLTRGYGVLASGPLQQREFVRKDGTKGTSLDLRANEIELLGPPKNTGGVRGERQLQQPAASQTTARSGGGGFGADVPDDAQDLVFSDSDIPFASCFVLGAEAWWRGRL